MNFKNIILTIALLNCAAFAQTSIQAQLSEFSREVPLIGFNTNAHHTTATWTLQTFRDSTAFLSPSILRYPGGSTANYWDWQTGWFMDSITLPIGLGNLPQILVRPEEFKLGLDAAESEGLFVLNIQNSNISHQMDGLRHINSLGIIPKYIEIGNEHNLSADSLEAGYYAQQSKIWCDSIIGEFPNSKICLVGGEPPKRQTWHDNILAYNTDFDALAFHVYIGANNSDGIFDVNRALEVPFSILSSRYNVANFDEAPDSIDVWVTEYNLWEQGNGGQPLIVETWTHALYVIAMNHIFLQNPRITMVINNNLTNHYIYAALDVHDNSLKANGVAMKLLQDVSKGMETAAMISFNPDPQINYNATSFSKLIGWKFKNESSEKGFLCNFSAETFNVSLSACNFLGEINYNQFYGDTALIVSSLSSLTQEQGSTNDLITIYPYSMIQLESASDPLPVELISFNAEIVKNNVTLNWSTATEINNYGFEVERTSPFPSSMQGEGGEAGRGWERIGFVKGNGNSNSPKIYEFFDDKLSSGKYFYRLKQIDLDGSFEYSKEIEAAINLPTQFSLSQNYPNPFNPTTKIKFIIPPSPLFKRGDRGEFVSLKVYDVLGNEIATLVNEEKTPGNYEVEWNAENFSSGIYFYTLQAGNFISNKKMILIK